MSRHDSFDDDFDDYPPQRAPKSSAGLIVGLVIGGVVLVILLGVFGVGMAFYRAERSAVQADVASAAQIKQAATTRSYSRDEFKTLVMGKTQDEVIAAIGGPDISAEGDGDVLTWTYYGRTVHPKGKVDRSTTVTFVNGKVASMSHS